MGKLIFDDRERVARWVAQGGDPLARYGNYYAMGAEREGELVAGIVIDHMLPGANGFAHITIAKPGKDTYALIRAFFDYAFRQQELKRVTGMCPSVWTAVLAFDKKLGFEEEFRIKDGFPGGDMVMLVMRPETCKWLEGNTR
jgi:RimJ/RimL family protein N-acetyltransferase